MDQIDFEVGRRRSTITANTASNINTTHHNGDDLTSKQSHGMSPMDGAESQWSFTEELQLLQARAAGKTWSQINVYHFPSKTTAICQAYYEMIMTRAGRRNGNGNTSDQHPGVGKATETSSEPSWVPIQAEMGEAWEVVEEMLTHTSSNRASTQTISDRRRVKSLAPSHSVRSNVSTDSGVYMGPSRSSSGSVRNDDLAGDIYNVLRGQSSFHSLADMSRDSFSVLPPIQPPGDVTSEPRRSVEWEAPPVVEEEEEEDDEAPVQENTSAGRARRTLRRFESRIDSPNSSASEQTDSETSFRRRMRDNVAVKLTRASQKPSLRRPLSRKSGFRRSRGGVAAASASEPLPDTDATTPVLDMESPISRKPTPTLRCSSGRSIKKEASMESRFDGSSDEEDALQEYISRFAEDSDDEGLNEMPTTQGSEDEHSTTTTVRAAVIHSAADCPRPDSPILPAANSQSWPASASASPQVDEEECFSEPECRRASTFSIDSACETSSDTSMPSMHGGALQTHLVEGLLPWFERWLAAQFRTHGSGGRGGGRSRNGSQGFSQSGGEGNQAAGSKRQPNDDDADEMDESNGDGGFGKDPKKARMSPEDEQRFACPYFKHNPIKYRDWRSCPGPGFKTVHRLKEHLYRRHLLPKFTCRRCYEGFESDDELVGHQRSDTPCTVKVSHEREGIDEAQERRLRARSATAKTEYQRWIDVYRILFPNDDPSTIPHPYYDLPMGDTTAAAQGADCSHDDVFMNLEKYVRREAPQFLQKELEGLESELQTLINARLKAKLEDVLPRIHLQLIDGYRKSECDAVLPVVKEDEHEEEEAIEPPSQQQQQQQLPHHSELQQQQQQQPLQHINTEFQRSVKYLEGMAMADFACDWDVRIAPCPVGAAGAPSMVSGSEFKDSSFSSPELDGVQSATDAGYECWAPVPFPGGSSSQHQVEDECLSRQPFVAQQQQRQQPSLQHYSVNNSPVSHHQYQFQQQQQQQQQQILPHHGEPFGMPPQENLSSGKQEAMSVEAWSRLCAGAGDMTNATGAGDYEPYFWP